MLKRPLAAIGVATAVVLAGAAEAFADDGWGVVDCSQNPRPGCELGVGKGGGGSDVPRRTYPRTPPSVGNGGGGGTAAPRDPNLADCAYERSGYKPPPEVAPAAYPRSAGRQRSRAVQVTLTHGLGAAGEDSARQGNGGWYVYRCTRGGTRDAFYRPPVWIPNAAGGAADPAPAPAPADLARRARAQLRLPEPEMGMSPRGEQLVNLPTWLWLARSDWRRVSAAASVPGVSVTAAARPAKTVWTFGDGSSVTCQGPGTPYAGAVDANQSSPDCGHTYRTSSAGRPSCAYIVSATVHWKVTWAGAGQTGTFPDLTTTSNASVRVAESHALNTRE